MSGALTVIQPGLITTVQDLGRIGHQAQGFPVAGAADPVALRAANAVVGNPQGAAGLEIALAGPTLEVAAESVRVAIAGGTTGLDVLAPDGHVARRAGPLESVRLVAGERLRIAAVTGSAVACLAVEGGLEVPPFLGSLSTYLRGGFGGFMGRALKAGDRLPLARGTAQERPELRGVLELGPPKRPVRVVLGPQDDYFTAEAIDTFLSAPYTVTREADRMGLRLDGPKLAHTRSANIVSDGIAPGAIQVPGNGLPIVLMADRQTMGGYPKIATVISADLPALGRASPGAILHFERVTVEAAQAARRGLEAEIAAFAASLAPAAGGTPDVARLAAENLVSGVVCAHHGHHE